jgi:hypothetical protein
MKNAKRNSREKDHRTVSAAKLRAAALQGLSKTVLKDVKGGDGTTTQLFPSDPIC